MTVSVRRVASLGLLTLFFGSSLVRGDERDGLPIMEKPLAQPFLTGLVGAWATESQGAFGPGKGSVQFRLGVGGTALIDDYENFSGSGGKVVMTMHGMGISKVSTDGQTLTRWWFDDQRGSALVMSGGLTELGWDISGHPNGDADTTARMKLEKTSQGLSVTLFANGHKVWAEKYKRVAK